MIRLVALAAVDSLQKYLSDGATPVPSFTAAQLLDRVQAQAEAHVATTAQLGEANAKLSRYAKDFGALMAEKERLERGLAVEQRQSEERLTRLLKAESTAMEANRLLEAVRLDHQAAVADAGNQRTAKENAAKAATANLNSLLALKELAKAVATVDHAFDPAPSNAQKPGAPVACFRCKASEPLHALAKWIRDYEEIPF